MRVTAERGGTRRLSGLARIDDAHLGGERTGGRRGAEGGTPFVAAAQTSEEGHPQRIRLSAVKGFRESEMAGRHLHPGSRAASDGLRRFEAVTEAGGPREAAADAPRWKGPGSAGPARCREI